VVRPDTAQLVPGLAYEAAMEIASTIVIFLVVLVILFVATGVIVGIARAATWLYSVIRR
jgi:hypothetical protein